MAGRAGSVRVQYYLVFYSEDKKLEESTRMDVAQKYADGYR